MKVALPDTFLSVPFAHRGYHDRAAGRPENSRAAFRAAIRAGYGIELDLQLTRDGQAVAFHDYDTARLTGTPGPIRQKTAAEAGTMTLIGGDAGVPTLTEVLDLVAGQVPLLLEIKDQDGAMGPDVGALEQAVADALRSYTGPVAVMSFNPHSIAAMARFVPHVPRGLVSESFTDDEARLIPVPRRNKLRDIEDYDRVGASFISHEAADLSRARVAELKALGATILCWTIFNRKEEVRARKVAQNITFEGYAA